MKEKNDVISVIVPIYKVEEFLDECIQSIVDQTYQNLQIILVDDGSPDRCGEICEDWARKDKRIEVIHKKNGGLSDARNAGLAEATGEFIAFVDSDDWIEPQMYAVNLSGICNNCQNSSICHSCAAMAMAETGRFDGIPVYMCEMVKTMKKLAQEQLKIYGAE